MLSSLPLSASAKLKVVTTTTDLAALTREVGGELVEAESLCRSDQDPHHLEPKPGYAVKLNRADLLIEVGLQLEVGWLPVLLTQSRNPQIRAGGRGHLNASEGVRRLEIPAGPIDRSQGDVHPEGNPHYWLNPENGLEITKRIKERLQELDPENSLAYERNWEIFSSRLTMKMAEWRRRASSLRGKKIITHHKSFSYLVDWTGLDVRDQIEPKPGIPPSPAHLMRLLSLIRREKIPLIVTENYYDPRPARELSERTGAKYLILPISVDGEKGLDSYEKLFDALLAKLAGSL
ncbi:MAG: zinc ABC transporter substrate-binding protein [Deltaproteobacteria bacterium]|nr:zinc ABC transporter substrate-binding protein [Deltaproteobacteria bacterium]